MGVCSIPFGKKRGRMGATKIGLRMSKQGRPKMLARNDFGIGASGVEPPAPLALEAGVGCRLRSCFASPFARGSCVRFRGPVGRAPAAEG